MKAELESSQVMNSVIAHLFWALALLAFCHFLWDGVLAPIFRLRIRFELFAIRDKIRSAMQENLAGDTSLQECEKLINSAIYIVHNFGLIDYLFMQMAFKDHREDEESSVAIPEFLQDDFWRAQRCVKLAVVINSFMLFIYLFPVVYCLVQLGNFKKLIFRPMAELEHYFPKSQYAT